MPRHRSAVADPPVGVASLELHPSRVVGGDVITATVTLTAPAPDGGATVVLSSNAPSVSCPPSLTIPAGTTAGECDIETAVVQTTVDALVTASLGVSKIETPVRIRPAAVVSSVTLADSALVGGRSTLATVVLDNVARAGGALLVIQATNASISVPSTATVPEGQITFTFPVATTAVAAKVHAFVLVICGGVSQTAPLEVDVARPHAMSIVPAKVVGGSSIPVNGTLALDGDAPPGGATFPLAASDATISVPPQVTVPAGTAAGTFSISTTAVTGEHVATVTSGLESAHVTLEPAGLSSLTLPAAVAVTSVTGTVSLDGSAPTGGASVTISATDGHLTPASQTVVIPAGQSTASFTVTAPAVNARTPAGLQASYRDTQVKTSTFLDPPLIETSFSPDILSPDGVTVLSVTLAGVAPDGGAAVALQTEIYPPLSPPPSVAITSPMVVPAGASTAVQQVACGPSTHPYVVIVAPTYEGSSAVDSAQCGVEGTREAR
jgi:hypothetical protein